MKHEQRIEVAHEVASRILEKYGERVTAIAVYGSVAKGEDMEHSDLDMWVATATSEPVEDVRFFVYRGIPVSINWDTEEGRIKTAGRVSQFWPIDTDEVRSFLVLFERGDFVERLREAASDLSDEDFARCVRVLMARACESANKVRNAWEAGDQYRLLVEGRWLAWMTGMVLGLLNRRYYAGGRGFYQIARQMEKKPKDYDRLVDLAGGFTTVEAEVVYRAAVELWENLCELVRAEGVEWEYAELPF